MTSIYVLDEHGAAADPSDSAPPARAAVAHYHITAYRPEGTRKIGPIVDRRNADRIANNFVIRHPDARVFVKACDGSCR